MSDSTPVTAEYEGLLADSLQKQCDVEMDLRDLEEDLKRRLKAIGDTELEELFDQYAELQTVLTHLIEFKKSLKITLAALDNEETEAEMLERAGTYAEMLEIMVGYEGDED